MTKRAHNREPRGFTLIELMIAAAIIGLLASIAIPQFARATLRSRAAERRGIMEAVARATNDTVGQLQRIPGGALAGAPNPPGTPGTTRRAFVWAMATWRDLPMVVEGGAYYSYSFAAIDSAGDGRDVTLTVTAEGDLDGDSTLSTKSAFYRGLGYSFAPDPAHTWPSGTVGPEDPPSGMEDQATF